MPDPDGYPTDEELDQIKKWDCNDMVGCFGFIRSLWTYDCYWLEGEAASECSGKPVLRYEISTGGWSGNEDIIEAMHGNVVLWLMTWVQSRRGGHYIFEIKK